MIASSGRSLDKHIEEFLMVCSQRNSTTTQTIKLINWTLTSLAGEKMSINNTLNQGR